MFKKVFSTLICSAVVSMSVQAVAKEVTIPTARGEATLKVSPSPIAVFDTGSLDTLQALGVKVEGTPDSEKMLPYLKPTFDNAQKVGTLFEPNMEALFALKPELIIVGTRSAKKYDDVSKIATAIDLTNNGDKLVDSALERIDSLGKLFDKSAEAEKLHNEIQTLLNATQTAVKGKGNGLIVLVNGGKISAYGSGGRFSWIHNNLGVPQADPELKGTGHGQPISFEFIQKLNPDWLFVLDRLVAIGQEGKAANEVLDNELVRQTTAWQKGQVVYLSSAAYLAPGGVEQIRTDLTNIKNAFEKK